MKFLSRSCLAVLIVLTACTAGKDNGGLSFPSERSMDFRLISGELYYSMAYDIFEDESHIFLIAYDLKDKTTLQVYNKQGEKVRGAVPEGRGPGEVTFFNSTLSDEEDIIYNDLMTGKILRYDKASMSVREASPLAETVLDIPKMTIFMCSPDDGKLYVRYESPRMLLFDANQNPLDSYDKYQVEDPNKAVMSTVFSKYAVTPDMTKLAVGTSLGVVLETFSMEGDSIKVLSVNSYVEPDFEVLSGTYDFNEHTVLGFNDVYATDDRIYTVYDGEVNPYWNKGERTTYTKIAVFDWEGNPLELIRTDYKIEKICYSDAENTLYAAVLDPDGVMYLAKLEL